MVNPERVIVIALMAGIVAGAYTWFGWEMLENLWAMISGSITRKKAEAAERERLLREQTEREVREQLGQ